MQVRGDVYVAGRAAAVFATVLPLTLAPAVAAEDFTFRQCLDQVHAIRDGTQNISNITGATITPEMLERFNYTGPTRLSKEKPRPPNFTTLTLEGT
jgi:hypothetical protein